jgi:hypothetical protein
MSCRVRGDSLMHFILPLRKEGSSRNIAYSGLSKKFEMDIGGGYEYARKQDRARKQH